MTLDSSPLTTTHPTEHPRLEQPEPTIMANLRDLGGLPVAGGPLRHRVLWRADDISLAPRRQIEDLADLGLRTVIDLRSDQEQQSSQPEIFADLGIHRHHLPLSSTGGDPAALAQQFATVTTTTAVGQRYATLIKTRATELVRALEIMADSEGGVLFHCAAGKDRTGVLAACLLSVLGAHPDTIVADYAATAPNLPGIMARLYGGGHLALREAYDPDRKNQPPMLEAHAESMIAMLHVLKPDGGPVGVLRAAGLDHALETQLKGRLIEH